MQTEIIHSLLAGLGPLIAALYLFHGGLLTLLVMSGLVFDLRHRKRPPGRPIKGLIPGDRLPPISVVILAGDRIDMLLPTLHAGRDLDYPVYEVIVVLNKERRPVVDQVVEALDLKPQEVAVDRDRPGTSGIRRIYAGGVKPCMTVIDGRFRDESEALNFAVRQAAYPYVMTLSPGTMPSKEALRRLIGPFLAGRQAVLATIGRLRSTPWAGQGISAGAGLLGIERIKSFWLDLSAWAGLNGCWAVRDEPILFERRTVLKAGGYPAGTIGLNAALLLRLQGVMREHGLPFRILPIPNPVGCRAVPADLKSAAAEIRQDQQVKLAALRSHFALLFNPACGALGLASVPVCWWLTLLIPWIELIGYAWLVAALPAGFLPGGGLLSLFILIWVYPALLTGSLIFFMPARHRPLYPAGSVCSTALLYVLAEPLLFRPLKAWWQVAAIVSIRSTPQRPGNAVSNYSIRRLRYSSYGLAVFLLILIPLLWGSLSDRPVFLKNRSSTAGSIPGTSGDNGRIPANYRPLATGVGTQSHPEDMTAQDGGRSERLDEALENARQLANAGRLSEAKAVYRRLVEADSESETILEEYAGILIKTSDYGSAIEIYDRLLNDEPDAVDLRLRRAMALLGAGDLKGAIREYKTVLSIDPENAEARIAISELKSLIPNPLELRIGVVLSLILTIVLITLIVLVVALRRIGSVTVEHAWRERFVRVVAAITLVVGVYYVTWRLIRTMNWDAWWFSVPVFTAELYGLVAAAMFFFMVWRIPQRVPPHPLEGRSVDVFITTYNESPDILRKTILGCQSIRYPHRTYVLDDGNRPEVAALARELGCEYIAREQNINAKAGNLNNALRQTSGEFIATFDADHVPLPHFLDRLLGYFQDGKVAFVQTPQDFYNVDSFQHHLDHRKRKMWSEQSLFFNVIQPGKDHWNSAFYCGTCAILRRSALEEIGGFPEETITEDLHVSIRLHARGYKSVYHPESLAYGLAAQTAVPFHIQRLRWGQGAMQVLVKDNPFWIKGLTLPQRISYLASMTTYFDGFQKLIFYLSPVLYFLTGVLPIKTFDSVFLLTFVPYLGLFLLSFELMSRGHGSTLLTERYNMAKFSTFIKSSAGLVRGKRMSFRITPKQDTHRMPAGVVYAQTLVFAIGLAGIVIGTVRYFYRADLEYLAYWGNLIWALCNTGLAAKVIHFSRSKVQRRRFYRFVFRLPCLYQTIGGGCQAPRVALLGDCHERGALLVSTSPVPEGGPLEIAVRLPDRVLRVKGVVVQSHRKAVNSITVYAFHIRFTEVTREQMDAIAIYAVQYLVPRFMGAYNKPKAVFDRLQQLVRPDHRQDKRHRSCFPVVIEVASVQSGLEIAGVSDDVSRTGISVVCLEELVAHSGVRIVIDLGSHRIRRDVECIRSEELVFSGHRLYRYAFRFSDSAGEDRVFLQTLQALVNVAA